MKAVQEPCFLGQHFSSTLTFLRGISFLCGRVSAGHIKAVSNLLNPVGWLSLLLGGEKQEEA